MQHRLFEKGRKGRGNICRENCKYGAIRNSLFLRASPWMATPLNDRPVGRSVGRAEASLSHSVYRKVLYPPCHTAACCAAPRRAMPCHAMPCRAAPRCGTVCRAILSRVAWLVVSFLYSFVGKSAASLVFKRRQRGPGERRAARRGEGKTRGKRETAASQRGLRGEPEGAG